MRLYLPILLAKLAVASPLYSVSRDEVVNYDGHHVFSITPSSVQEARNLVLRFETYPHQPIRNTLSVVIPRDEVEGFRYLGLNARLIDDNLGSTIRQTDKPSIYKRNIQEPGALPDLQWFETYHPYNDHLQYWDDLVAAIPKNSEKFSIGQSYENRTIWAYKLFGNQTKDASAGEQAEDKPIILWHATVHAREWISTMVIEYLAYQLIAGFKSGDANITVFWEHYDFYLVPFHNPDGFVYTQTTNRLWRKNRQPRPTTNSSCVGTDGNRNWKFEWDAEPPEGGSSLNPCGETYRGLAPGDTPENQALDGLSAQLSARNPGIRSFIDFHSYGQLILTPYGYTCDPLPESLPRMLEVAGGTARAIEAASERNSTYEFGPGCQILYFSTGNSRDHHYGVHKAPHSWTLELSPQNASGGGFVLPPEQIWPVVKEQWAGQLWLLRDVWDD